MSCHTQPAEAQLTVFVSLHCPTPCSMTVPSFVDPSFAADLPSAAARLEALEVGRELGCGSICRYEGHLQVLLLEVIHRIRG